MTLEIVDRAISHDSRIAIIDQAGKHSYAELLSASAGVATALLGDLLDLGEERVVFMVDPSFDYVRTQWGIWRAGAVAVPLCLTHPPTELAYVLDDARPATVVAGPQYDDVLRPLATERGLHYLRTDELSVPIGQLPPIEPNRRAMMLYTSGTTGRPKGVVTTHATIAAQITSLIQAWEWEDADRILLTLPLHHIHGIVNVVSCALWAGAVCEMASRFDAEAVWHRLSSGDLSLYMAVPTIYHRLIGAWDEAEPDRQRRWSEGCQRLRLMVSGSAALPVQVLERWREISGQTLLERYGMTEIGMALSNPLRGERIPGHVGRPLPSVEARLVDETGQPVDDGVVGEIQIRGENVFLEYWDRPEATQKAFAAGGWFRTGDVAVSDDGVYRILGRASVDIIKTGGEKVSALEIEEVLLGHDQVEECAVVGLDDPEWGQRVVAAVVPVAGQVPTPEALRSWCKERLAPYKVPKDWHLVPELPRNAMGKVTKPDVVKLLSQN
jgi:malonyl-CoA/methylmalonyl-CoA synthetase